MLVRSSAESVWPLHCIRKNVLARIKDEEQLCVYVFILDVYELLMPSCVHANDCYKHSTGINISAINIAFLS